MKGFAVLTAWHAGTYYPGFERTLNDFDQNRTLNSTMDNILLDYLQAARVEQNKEKTATFAEVCEGFYRDKYEDSKKTYSKASMNSTRAAFKSCAELHDKPFADLRYHDLQNVIDNCPKKHSSLELIMCYSGYRIKAYETIEVNLKEKYFRGGVKTDAGKDRIVPIRAPQRDRKD
ncbi:hypothetical protein D3Z62_00505 [Lachnospiraceae bacterium]|jgi:hypothetical protein|nr:hypothetical protein [Lachnospiraceae bacterium]